MSQAPTSVCITTLGSQPQVTTLALDALLAQGVPIGEVIVVHLSAQNLRYQAALACLAREFAGERYAGRPIRYRTLSVRVGDQVVDDLSDEAATDAALNTFHRLIQQLKQQQAVVHLCLTGGRRLLGMLALSAALLYFDQADRIWHLYSSDAVRRQTDQGALLHLPGSSEVRLVRVPLPPWGHLFPALRLPAETSANAVLELQTGAVDDGERARCRQIYDRLTLRQRDVLRAFAGGLTPQEVAERLAITLATVNTHKTTIFDECRIAWNLAPDKHLDYHWLREKFTPYFAA